MIRRLANLLRGIVDELTDQTAYRRYLQAHGLRSSGPAWRAFSEQRMRARYSRAKCC